MGFHHSLSPARREFGSPQFWGIQTVSPIPTFGHPHPTGNTHSSQPPPSSPPRGSGAFFSSNLIRVGWNGPGGMPAGPPIAFLKPMPSWRMRRALESRPGRNGNPALEGMAIPPWKEWQSRPGRNGNPALEGMAELTKVRLQQSRPRTIVVDGWPGRCYYRQGGAAC